jgi:hypothetical protein
MRIGSPNVAVFGPSPLLTVRIEARPDGVTTSTSTPAGRVVWVARTAGELGAKVLDHRPVERSLPEPRC